MARTFGRVIILFFLFSAFVKNTFAITIVVDAKGAVSTITRAFEIANNGDTVIVKEGVYKEGNLTINKSITFLAKGKVTLDGQHKYEVLSIKASNVWIEGFTLINSGVSSIVDMGGIKVYEVKNVTIKNNVLIDCFFGIYIQHGKNCVIKGNTVTAHTKIEQDNGNGIHGWKSDSLLILKNTVSGHRDGYYLEFVTNTTILNNISENNLRYGLHFMFSHGNFYINNSFINNGAGVAVMYSRAVKMYNNHFSKNWGDASYGLLLKELNDSYIEGNEFENNTVGIFADGATRVEVRKNIFRQNGWAVKMQANCMDMHLENNNFIANSFDIGTNGSLVLNTLKKNYWDKYEGYDLNKDNIGDIPFRPVSLFSMIIEQSPPAMILFRSFMASLLDKTEKILPSITPEGLKDEMPLMKPNKL
ncbi:MAG: nitrous oxide reductase family maturation protein NosD [Ferruginibacter sp.]|nr:nitrous oxide reductase family maturation protein NosD [Ferruginibacter sp.]